MPGALAGTRGLMCKFRRAHELEVTTGTANHRHSLRDGFTVSFVLSPETGLFVSVACAIVSQAWHQRRDVRTTRLRRPQMAHSSHAPLRPSHPVPNVRDDREASLKRVRDGIGLLLFLGMRKAKYFLRLGWTGESRTCPSADRRRLRLR